MKDLRINQSTFPLKNGGTGVIAIFMYAGDEDPKPILEDAIRKYTEGTDNYDTFIDAQMNCPWVRVIISGISEMEQMNFNDFIVQWRRDQKLNELGI
jgi:hypothetical protein